MQPVLITTSVVSSKSANGEVFSIEHYVIKFVSDLRQVSGFLLELRFPLPIDRTQQYKLIIVLSGVKYQNPTQPYPRSS